MESMTAPAASPIVLGDYRVGRGHPLLLIAGPCVLQDAAMHHQVAEELARLQRRPDVNVVFKASFDKANRTSAAAGRGPGIDEGLRMLEDIRTSFGLPVTTDVHLPDQATAAGQVCDVLQIPAFLSRQTDLLLAAAATGKVVNVKKGQFMAPEDMRYAVEKVRHGRRDAGFDGDAVMVCERGTFFGYGRLVNDMTGLVIMRQMGVPVVFDATHSVQRPGVRSVGPITSPGGGGGMHERDAAEGGATGGNREMVEPLALAAVAVGVDALFFETHPHPEASPSDGANMIALSKFADVVDRCLQIRATRNSFHAETTVDAGT